MIQPSSSPAASGASSSGAQGGLAQAASDDMGKEAFLQLLVAQLGNQDPMNPMKGQEFAAQLAQFSSVEQMTNLNSQIASQRGSIDALMQSVNSGVAADLIGKTVEAAGNEVGWSGEGEATLGLDLEAPASEVTVEIKDDAGNVVATRTLEDVSDGTEEITWDGTDDDGNTVAEGTYTFEVTATDAEGNDISASTYTRGVVERITFGEDGTMVWVNGVKLSMGQVRSLGMGGGETGGEGAGSDMSRRSPFGPS